MIIPPRLQRGDKVALVAPARWPTEDHLEGLAQALERHGLVPYRHPQLYNKPVLADGSFAQLAGSDAERAAALNEVLRAPSIKGVLFPRAGTGSYRLLDLIDYDAVRRNPKLIMGYSDVDIVLQAITQRTGLVTFRGPMGVNFASSTMDPRTEEECFALLSGDKNQWTWTEGTALQEGVAEGPLIGGNLAVMNANIGTPYDWNAEGCIVVLEECDELLFRLDRFLYQASMAGKFARAKAVLFGTIENMLDGEQHDGSGSRFGMDVPEMLRHYVPKDIPLVYGLPLGHGAYLSSHPVGAPARVEVGKDATRMTLVGAVVG